MNENIQQFLETAEQLAQVAAYDSIRLGLAWSNTSPAIALAVSAVLVRSSEEPQLLEPLNAGIVSARQVVKPREYLHQLLASIETGAIERISEQELSGLIWLSTPGRPVRDWSYSRVSSRNTGLGSYLHARGESISQILKQHDVDRIIAVQSDYTYSSFGRLVKAYTGIRIEHDSSISIELSAPWPLMSLAALSDKSRLRVTAEGLTQLDTSRFILNIEGARQDQRLDASTLQWLSGPPSPDGTCTYTSVFEPRDPQPTAINLYISHVPALSLHTQIPDESASRVSQPLPPIQLPFIPPRVAPAPLTQPESAGGARLTALRVQSFRLLHSAEFKFNPPFTVIVGPNQSGKSSVLDALQLLSDAARGELSDALIRRRSGLRSVQSRGSTAPVRLEAELQTATGKELRYRLQLGAVGAYDFAVEEEEIAEHVQDAWVTLFSRSGGQATLSGIALPTPNSREALLSQLGGIIHPVVQLVRASISSISVYPYFRTGASWADPESIPMRRPARLEPGAVLERTGNNLSAALISLREERPDDWRDFTRIVRLAFPNMKELRFPPVSRGTAQLFWDEINGSQFDTSELSDGTLHFLAILCALFQPGNAIIAVDEPEAHLHPDAILRLVGAARSLSERTPILFTTQSDALIGLLDDAPECVVVAKREEQEARLIRPEVEELREWIKSFSLREMRRELENWDSTP